MNIDDVAASIKKANTGKPLILIGIDGFGGSGKSTLAKKLQLALGDAQVIGIDDFIIKDRLLEVSAEEVLFDRSRLESQVLKPLSEGNTAHYQKLNWVQNTLEEPIELKSSQYVIVEGISVLHPDIAGYYDYKIWVDAPVDVAKQRGRQRDAGNENEAHWDIWSANDVAYQAKYHPELKADFTVKNIGFLTC
jgi:uridine kinase